MFQNTPPGHYPVTFASVCSKSSTSAKRAALTVGGAARQKMSKFGSFVGFTAGGFGEMNVNTDIMGDRIAPRAAKYKWRLMGATSLAQAKQTFVVRVQVADKSSKLNYLELCEQIVSLEHVYLFISISDCKTIDYLVPP